MDDLREDDLVRDLATLGRLVDRPAPSAHLTTEVMARVAALADAPDDVVTTTWRVARDRMADVVRSRRRRVALVVGVVLLALLATPPVRAAVAEWFGFGGLLVETGVPGPSTAPPPPTVTQDRSVREAAAAVDFPVMVPADLGAPDGVEVPPDLRMVSMSWSTGEDGVVRLDQFDAEPDFSVAKTAPGVSFASVGGTDALWFEEPHEVVLLEPDGTRRTESARPAGHTLVWLDGVTTLRLEGDLTLDRAVEIAESTVTVD